MKNQLLHSLARHRSVPPTTNSRNTSFFAAPRVIALGFIFSLLSTSPAQSQALATWGFNGNNVGIAGVFNFLLPADFSPSIPVKAYNPTVYYGEGGWPAGAMDPNAYFEFGLGPLVGNSLNISSLAVTLRRSSTGTSGAGPNLFVIRSSVDGYTSNLSGGTLSVNATTFNITPGSSFLSLILGVRFRVYGYQTTISSGGLSRLVMENVQVNGVGSVLAAHIANFSAMLRGSQAVVDYAITNNEPGTVYDVQRSFDGTNYTTIHQVNGDTKAETFNQSVEEAVASYGGQMIYYRLRMIMPGGSSIYSRVSVMDLRTNLPAPLSVVRNGRLLYIRYAGSPRSLQLVSSAGQVIVSRALPGTPGSVTIDVPSISPGVYIVAMDDGRQTQSARVYLP